MHYQSNSAAYGPNIASYPVKIKLYSNMLESIVLDDVGSGIMYDQTLEFGLFDYDDQVMILNSQDQVTISATDSQSSSVSGINSGLLNQGMTSFDSLVFVSASGTSNVLYDVRSKAIDSRKVRDVFGQTINDTTISVNFRYCKPGEVNTDNNQ